MGIGMRREHDALGEKDVPQDALYGIQTTRAVENFAISGLPPRDELVSAVVLVKKAAALVNAELGLLARDRAEAISTICCWATLNRPALLLTSSSA